MPTTRTVRADRPGPAHIRTSLAWLDATVIAEPGRSHAELTISTADDTGPSADAVNQIDLAASGATLEARLTQPGPAVTTIIRTSGGVSSFSSVNIAGGIVVAGGGTVMVNGRLVTGDGDGATVITGSSPVTVTARVPQGSSVIAASVSGDIETRGQLAEVDAASTSGDVMIDEATLAQVRTVSGDIAVDHLTGTAHLTSTSGDVTVCGGPSTRARVRTVSGDVRGLGGVDLEGSSVSGRVRSR